MGQTIFYNKFICLFGVRKLKLVGVEPSALPLPPVASSASRESKEPRRAVWAKVVRIFFSVALQTPEDFKVSLIQVVAIDMQLPLDPFQTGERTAKRAQRRVVSDPELASDVLELGECSAKRGEVDVLVDI